ncbi:hypothetical protein P344_07140 [Spiroplasma mirum ATCC 29335]|uniref:Uncharacterized protein n=1 Tax=Spiroplasma mirum ATCC 29335 TaxID=838561 RepID=W0GN12_9MOLU|nr:MULTISPECIES: hypothetical protein [Spiroplasma]AHF61567.1 hypothetical protein SMM_1200 [Spiroplasma mirum ATCC 29335]AHI58724.1 hypothetical protein P344_07140 [Spiroplasma mirum ATCC 29335]AKM53601.1 hypothetical protein SATRI_v1c12690 [Spiroplasma atrichopogonis]
MKNLFKILTFLCLTTTLILPVISCHSQRPKFGNNEDPSCQEIIAEKYYQEKYLQLEKYI